MIYFIKQHRGTPIRIGIAMDINARIQKLQAGSSKRLACLKIIRTENDHIARRIIQKEFGSLKIEKSSWFVSTRIMQVFLNNLQDKKFYRISDIIYELYIAKQSVNELRIKVDVDQVKQKMGVLKYNQNILAKKIGFTRQGISILFIRQRTSLFTIQKIATTLKCTVQEITLNGQKH